MKRGIFSQTVPTKNRPHHRTNVRRFWRSSTYMVCYFFNKVSKTIEDIVQNSRRRERRPGCVLGIEQMFDPRNQNASYINPTKLKIEPNKKDLYIIGLSLTFTAYFYVFAFKSSLSYQISTNRRYLLPRHRRL